MRGKTGPFLSLEIDEADVDMACRLILSANAQGIGKVGGGIGIDEIALLQPKMTNAEERLSISIQLFMSNDVTWANQIGVFTDIGGGTPGVVNFPFRSRCLAKSKSA